jgi:hypothetical protein
MMLQSVLAAARRTAWNLLAFGGAIAIALLSAARDVSACAGGATVSVSSTPGVLAALYTANDCDTISLAPGNYADLGFSGYPNRAHYNFGDYVTLQAQDMSQKPVFQLISFGYASHIRFDGIIIHHEKRVSDADYSPALHVDRTDHFELINSEIYGSVDGDYNNVIGLPLFQLREDLKSLNIIK